MKFTRFGAVTVGVAFVLGACSSAATPAPAASTGAGASPSAAAGGGTAKGALKIAIDLPMQGSDLASSQPIINGVLLAIKDAGGAAGGFSISVPNDAIYDNALNGAHDPQTGAANMQKEVGDAAIVAVIGPLNSSVAQAEIPISNDAGLYQCSPANTNPDLTKGAPAAQLRTKANNYVRVVTTDDNQGPAAAQYMIQTLGKKNIYVIDDTETYGKGIADAFAGEVTKEGAKVVKHDAAPKTTNDYVSILTAAKALSPDAIYYGGTTATGGARILLAAQQAGLGDVPFMGGDGIYDGSATTKDSFLNLAGAAAKNSYSTSAGIGDFPKKAAFDAEYKAAYGQDPTGYASTGYACAQVVIDALNRANPADAASARAGVLTAGTDTTHTYDTILGSITFDKNGDTSQKIVSIYSYDPTGAGGKGDWVFKTQVDYGK